MLPLAKAGARHKSGQKQSEDVDAVFRVYFAIVVGQLVLEGNASNVIFLVSVVSTTLNYTHRELIIFLTITSRERLVGKLLLLLLEATS